MSLSSHINSLCDLGRLQDALTLVFSNPIQMDYSLYSRILQLCILRKAGKEGRLIHSRVLTNGLHSNPFMNTKLIIFYSKMGDMVTSRTLFDKMPERTVVTWTALLSGYTQNGCSEEALLVFSAMRCKGGYANQGFADDAFQLFRSMLRGGVFPDRFTLGNVMKAFLRGSTMMKVIQVHNHLTGSLIDAYAKCGSIRIAYHIYKSMPKKDTISCTALITGYARQGVYSRDSFDLFNEIHKMHLGLDGLILCLMLNMCANTMSLELGRQIHALAFKCQPYNDVAMGNALIDMYSKSGEIEGCLYSMTFQDDSAIITHYLVLARDPIIPRADKNSVCYSFRYFDYLFYIDFEASMAEPRAQSALGQLQLYGMRIDDAADFGGLYWQ
ncbi:hypothetical protein RHGRI_024365 [Rhododendron griersonianum]|uniref:Pentatricopeptide repeat-containing protein n=1 Tax=Rhododendron griersonianum TaxID=479676 RepID=A0AAV6J739_9ERIC|nr:hypothetical protein RHGRI_024365 [Rhododendron griersonianum]